MQPNACACQQIGWRSSDATLLLEQVAEVRAYVAAEQVAQQ